MEIVGIVIALIGALFVLLHARLRQLSIIATIGWALGTFFLLVIALPLYLLFHGPEPKPQDGEG